MRRAGHHDGRSRPVVDHDHQGMGRVAAANGEPTMRDLVMANPLLADPGSLPLFGLYGQY